MSMLLPDLERQLRDAWRASRSSGPARAPRRYRTIAVVMTGAAAITAAVLLAVGGGGTPTAAAALERAAGAAERGVAAPALQPGQYWYTRSVQAELTTPPGAGGDQRASGVLLQQRQLVERWVGLDGLIRGRVVPYGEPQLLGSAAGRRVGGAPAPGGVASFDQTFRAGTGVTPLGIPPGAPGAQFSSPLGNLDYQQVLALPTEPGAMLARIEAAAARARAGIESRTPGSELAGEDLRFYELPIAASILVDLPLAPAARAAVYRALERIRGIGYAPRVRDPLGRAGAALITRGAAPFLAGSGLLATFRYPFRNEVVFDPATGSLLAQQAVLTRPVASLGAAAGTPLAYTAYAASGAVDSARERPRGEAR